MSPAPRVKILILDVPVEIREAVDAEAEARDISRNRIAVEALIARYKLDPALAVVEERGGFRPQEETTDSWSISVPPEVRVALRTEAAVTDATISGLVRATLAERYGLPVGDITRKPSRPQQERTG